MQLPTMTVGLWCDCGSRYEHDDNNGVAHYFEHLVFKGSAQGGANGGQLTQAELELTVENKGCMLNAYTSREQTVYFCKGFVEEADYMVQLLANIVQKPLLEKDAIDRERSVITREMEDIEQNQEETVYDYLHEICFLDQPLGYTILGPRSIVNSIQRHEILDFVKKHYVPERMVLAAAGGIAHEDLVNLGNQFFKKSDIDYKPFTKPAHFSPGLKYQVINGMPQLHVAMATTSAEWSNPDSLSLMLASQMIGQYEKGGIPAYMTSLVDNFQKNNLAAGFRAFNTIYDDIGLWGIYLTVDNPEEPGRVNTAIEALKAEFTRMATPGKLDVDTVERAKKALLSQTAIQLDGTENVCEDIGRQILCYGRRIEWPEWEWRINDITAEDIQQALSRYIDNDEFGYAVIGPKCDLGVDESRFKKVEYI
jgi:processing peptidase subunit beta